MVAGGAICGPRRQQRSFMANLAESEFRTIIEDARTRHAAVISLMYAIDIQAIALLRLYVTLGIATASGTIAGLGPSALFPWPAAWALGGGTAVLVAGAAFCLRALKPARINLPGRNPEFWIWAVSAEVEREAVLRSYLDNLHAKGAVNSDINLRAARALTWAKRCGAVAPLGALLFGGAGYLCGS